MLKGNIEIEFLRIRNWLVITREFPFVRYVGIPAYSEMMCYHVLLFYDNKVNPKYVMKPIGNRYLSYLSKEENIDDVGLMFDLLKKSDPNIRFSPFRKLFPFDLTKELRELNILDIDLQYYVDLNKLADNPDLVRKYKRRGLLLSKV